jgi:hypothetical protein
MTTLKTAKLQFFFMQHEKPFLAAWSISARKTGSAFPQMLQIKASGKIPAPPP